MNDNLMKMKIAVYIRVNEKNAKEGYSIEFQLNSNISS